MQLRRLTKATADLCFEPYTGSHYEVRVTTDGSRLPTRMSVNAAGNNRLEPGGTSVYGQLSLIDLVTRELVITVDLD